MSKRKFRWICNIVGHSHNTNPVHFWCPRCGLAYEEFCGGLDMWEAMIEFFRNSLKGEAETQPTTNTNQNG